jgi:very-short-patch-repair endonuclease
MWKDPAMRSKVRAALSASPKVLAHRMSQQFPQKLTRIERTLANEFTRRGLRFEMHRTMFGRHQPDFVFEDARLIVQADGVYWHTRPATMARDAAFNALAEANGWTVCRFTDQEIKANWRACGKTVAQIIKERHATPST